MGYAVLDPGGRTGVHHHGELEQRPHRPYREIRTLLDEADLPPRVKDRARAATSRGKVWVSRWFAMARASAGSPAAIVE